MKSQPRIVITSGRLSIGTAMLLKDQGTAVEYEPETDSVFLVKEEAISHAPVQKTA